MSKDEQRFWSFAALIVGLASLYIGYLSLSKVKETDPNTKSTPYRANYSPLTDNKEISERKFSSTDFLSTHPTEFLLVTGTVGRLEAQSYVSVPTIQKKEMSGEVHALAKVRTFYFGTRYQGGVREKISEIVFGCESGTVHETSKYLDEKGTIKNAVIPVGIGAVWDRNKRYMTDGRGNRINVDDISVEIREMNEPEYRSLFNLLCITSSFESKNSLFVRDLYDPATVAKALYKMSNSINQ